VVAGLNDVVRCRHAGVDAVEKGDKLEVDVTGGVVRNLTNGKELKFNPLPEFMVEVLNAGGLAPYLNKTEEW
jgi:3-isopropylmalate/(R)-2-methylmalate dehydratase small subunit